MTAGEKYGLLTADIQFESRNYVKEVWAGGYHTMLARIQVKDLIKKCHDEGLKVPIWTADKDENINVVLLLEGDAIKSNKPGWAIKLRQQFIEDEGQAVRKSLALLDIL